MSAMAVADELPIGALRRYRFQNSMAARFSES